MKLSSITKYLNNCFLLMLPIMAWNIALANKLPAPFQPEVFSQQIPWLLEIGEQTFRLLIFLLAAVMPLSLKTNTQKIGILLYSIGVVVYGVSWLLLIYAPNSTWAHSYPGFLAPAFTPIFWLTGIALIGYRFYFNLPFRRVYFIVPAIIFLILHHWHTLIIYQRTFH